MTPQTLPNWIEDLEDGDEPDDEGTCDCGCAWAFCTLRQVDVDLFVCGGPEGDAEDVAYDYR